MPTESSGRPWSACGNGVSRGLGCGECSCAGLRLIGVIRRKPQNQSAAFLPPHAGMKPPKRKEWFMPEANSPRHRPNRVFGRFVPSRPRGRDVGQPQGPHWGGGRIALRRNVACIHFLRPATAPPVFFPSSLCFTARLVWVWDKVVSPRDHSDRPHITWSWL
jgi:hypothetical protein